MIFSNQMENLILKHNKLYPKMEIRDFVKLIYQSCFGAGHFVNDRESSLERLINEMSETENLPFANDDIESIGNSHSRFHLNSKTAKQLRVETINSIFVSSANLDLRDNTKEMFFQSLKIFRKLSLDGKINFSDIEIHSFLEENGTMNCEPISHSESYRQNYFPHYRVISEKYTSIVHYLKKIDSSLKHNKKVLIGIDGRCASGKTTLSDILGEIYDANVFRMDDFFLPEERKTKERLSEVGGNVDYERFYEEVLSNLRNKKIGESFEYGIFDCSTGNIAAKEKAIVKQINIIEGSYSHHEYFGELDNIYHVSIFLDIEFNEQLKRIIERNGKKMLEVFVKKWIPLEDFYFEKRFGKFRS